MKIKNTIQDIKIKPKKSCDVSRHIQLHMSYVNPRHQTPQGQSIAKPGTPV